MSILSILNQISNISSTKTKLQILEDNKDNELFKQVCYLTYDKANINFYIKKIPEYNTLGEIGIYNLETCLNMLSKLYTRELTGNNAIEYLKDILINAIDIETEEVIKRIIKRDLKCGMGTTQVNKVWKDLIPKFPYQRISLLSDMKPDSIDWKEGVYSQLKEDSMFANLKYFDKDNIELTSRTGSIFPIEKFSNIAIDAVVNLLDSTEYNGELQVERNGVILPREIGNGVLNSVLKGGHFADNEKPVYHIWDYIPLDKLHSKCKWNVPYKDRFSSLKELLVDNRVGRDEIDIKLVETRICYSIDEVIEHLQIVLSKGLEGLVIKLPNANWIDGTNKEMFKIKLEVIVDLKAIELNLGEGKNSSTFGSIKVVSSDGLLETNISGFTDEVRKYIYDNWETVKEEIFAVKANKLMIPTKNNSKYSLFLPRYIETRGNDKDTADSLEEIINQFESAILTIKKLFEV
jgi:DNA ligase-1